MAGDIAGLPYWEVGFDKGGKLTNDDGLPAALEGGQVVDLFVMVHGWNNSVESARGLYNDLFGRIARLIGDRDPDLRASAGAMGVFWPSLVLPDDDPTWPPGTKQASAAAAAPATSLAPVFPGQENELARIDELLASKPADPDSLKEAHELEAGLVTTPSDDPEESGMDAVTTASTSVVFGHLASLAAPTTGDAEGIGNIFTGLWHGAREGLRVASYLEMKNRAGVIGRTGFGPFLADLQARQPRLRVHLMGHSFGGRLIAFTLAGLGDKAGAASPVKSLLLIQAAFSHFTFATKIPLIGASPNGKLADCRDRVDGPLMCTFSAADLAVGRWYPAASMINGADAESAIDLTYRWGAMGHDGYQPVGDAVTVDIKTAGDSYGFEPGTFHRIASGSVIKAMQSVFSGAHSDIRHDEVVWPAVDAAIAAAKRPN